jgi:Glycosyl hydrolase 2 galactose-binding domain-like/Exo-beta-D-glucosaminidase Ig-fold domain/Glycosyl hydrolases family 2/NedA-like, galactose-binding domain
MMPRFTTASLVLLLSVAAFSALPTLADTATRGVGVYPGDPAEDFAPELVAAPAGRRNLALHRAATQSSAYDFNLTAQLVTDGIVESAEPRWYAVATSAEGELAKHRRPFVVDDNILSGVDFDRTGWLTLELGGAAEPLAVDRVEIGLRRRDWLPFGPQTIPGIPWPFAPPKTPPDPDDEVEWTLAASEDGREWSELGEAGVVAPPKPDPASLVGGMERFFEWLRDANPVLWTSVSLDAPVQSRRYRIELTDLEEMDWQVVEVRLYNGEERIPIGGPSQFASAWRSAGLGEEWVAVDLGAEAKLEGVTLHWLRPAGEGAVQVSTDGAAWSTVAALSGAGGREEIAFAEPVRARHVRALMTRPTSAEGYILSELEVFGEGGLTPRPKPQPAAAADGSLHLAGGNWRLQRGSLVAGEGPEISTAGYAAEDWIAATVPATVLSSYYNIGALPDPNYGANELAISDSFFYDDFWYRDEFQGPALKQGQYAFLELEGVNWKAEVFLNGARLGEVDGAFTRGRFDVTDHLRPGAVNALAIRIEKPATPGNVKQHTLADAGQNGGAIGADSPSYHASIGWDWIPTIRGRNIGLWNDVRLAVSGPVTIEDPYIHSVLPLPDTSSADLHLEVGLANHTAGAVAGELRGTFGDVAFRQPVELPAASTVTVSLDPSTHPELRLDHPQLWWPNGHGEPHLYDVELEFVTAAGVSDTKSFRTGVRQMSYTVEDEALRIFVNGRRVVPRGGNWGFPEANLRYRGREYDAAMRYHRDMNFTMVRNWVGQTGDDEFYQAADRYGLLVWQDFWLANPVDGPDPDDEALFMSNVRDTIRRIRNHPSVGLYCGRNEGQPPVRLEPAIGEAIAELHGEIQYVPNSMAGGVSGGGPYGVHTREFYFTERATEKLHSELGMTSVVTLDSLREMMPEDALWPMSLAWGLHDFNLESNQKARDFVAMVEEAYGGARDLAEWVGIAQLINYDGYRAMFEAQSKNRMGVQLWMTHPAWPSLTWQTYDYYFNPHASYFGAKKGSEPLHIQWNPVTDEVEVVNYGVADGAGLTARAEVLSLDGSLVWARESAVDSAYDSTVSPFGVEFPKSLSPVHFLRLRLERGGERISENFYWRGAAPHDYRALRTLPKVPVEVTAHSERRGDRYFLTAELENRSAAPALAVRLVAVRAESGDRILPALYSDNFIALMPGEKRQIQIELAAADARGESPRIAVEGFNLASAAP